jgi:hypothetical protein
MPLFFLAIGLFMLGSVAAEMYLGNPLDFSFTHNRFVQWGYSVLWVAGFLFLFWWVSKEFMGAKKGRH